MRDLKSTFIKIFKYDRSIYTNLSEINIHRIYIMGWFMGFLNIAHIAIFGFNYHSSPDYVVKWFYIVMGIHSIMFITNATLGYMALQIEKKRIQGRKIAYIVQALSIVANLFFGILLCVSDQLVTTNINPLFIAYIGIGVLFLIPPIFLLVINMFTLVLFLYLVTWTQHDPTLLDLIRINGITAATMGLSISWILWRSHSLKVEQQIIIENQKRILEESNKNLKQALCEYNLIAEYSLDLISVVNKDNVALFLSRSHQTILGMDPTEMVEINYEQFIHPDDLVSLCDSWVQASQEERVYSHVYRFQHADGHWVWLESYFVPVTNEAGEVEKFIITSRDITERKQTEDLLRNSEKLSVVGELAAGIAHEIRNPLTTLKGFAQLMKNEGTQTQKSFLNIMEGELDRIDLITNELLYLSKPLAQEMKEISAEKLLCDIRTLLQPEASLQNITLLVQVSENLPPITGVENKLKQVCINLIKNVIDAMPKGGKISIQATQENEMLLLAILDEGVGIPKERMETLGQPFYSLKEKGTGLGLTICKKIVEEHHGNMNFYSSVGLGTTVEVRLPLAVECLVS